MLHTDCSITDYSVIQITPSQTYSREQNEAIHSFQASKQQKVLSETASSGCDGCSHSMWPYPLEPAPGTHWQELPRVSSLALLRACCAGQQAAHYMTKNPKQISNQHNSQYPSCLISADEQKRLPPQAPVCHLPIAPVLVSSEPIQALLPAQKCLPGAFTPTCMRLC